MHNILPKEIYQAAQALLDKYKHNEHQAIGHVFRQFHKYSAEKNDYMASISLEIGIAVKELVTLDCKIEAKEQTMH